MKKWLLLWTQVLLCDVCFHCRASSQQKLLLPDILLLCFSPCERLRGKLISPFFMLSLCICIAAYCKLFSLDGVAHCERSHYLICHVCFAGFMHHIIILTQQLIPDPTCTWLLNKKMQLQTSMSHQIWTWTPHNVFNSRPWRLKRWKAIRNKWAVTGLMRVTKAEFDCQLLFCLLVGERAISIALTVHQGFSNWISAHSVSHRTVSITLTQTYQ